MTRTHRTPTPECDAFFVGLLSATLLWNLSADGLFTFWTLFNVVVLAGFIYFWQDETRSHG